MEKINTLLNLITAISAVIAAYIASKTLSNSVSQQKQALEREKKQATLEAYNKLQEQVLDPINAISPHEIKSIIKDGQSNDAKQLGGYLARIEHFCVGLETGIYDYDTFYKLAHGYFDSSVLKNRLVPILERKLNYAKEDYYANLHAVWTKMKTGSNNK